MVNPTAAMARTAAVTSPNPNDARKRLNFSRLPRGRFAGFGRLVLGAGTPLRPWRACAAFGPAPAAARVGGSWLREGPELGGGEVADHIDLAGRAVVVDLEDAGRIMEGVEAGRPARAYVTDGLALLECCRALGEAVHHRGPGRPVADLLHGGLVDARLRALGLDHRERREVDPVVEVHGPGCGQIGAEVAAA